MNFQDVLDTFFLHEDQDAFARKEGWGDADQMVYYENLAAQAEAQMLPPPPAEILLHELSRVDSREVYTDSEDCPRDGDFDMIDWQDLAGVY